MNTSPIVAAAAEPASFPSAACANCSADRSEFQQVLQQLHPAVASGTCPGTEPGADASRGVAPLSEKTASIMPLPDVAPAETTAALPRNSSAPPVSMKNMISPANLNPAPGLANDTRNHAGACATEAKPNRTGLLAGFIGKNPEPDATGISLGLPAKKPAAAGNVKEVKTTATRKCPEQESVLSKSAASPLALPASGVPTLAEPSAPPSQLLPAAQQFTSPQPSKGFNQLAPLTAEPASITPPADMLQRAAATALDEPASYAATSAPGIPAALSNKIAPSSSAVDLSAPAISAARPALVPEPTARTAFSPVEESTAAFTKSKAKPQTAISSSGKADSPARSAARTGSDAAAESPGRISNSHPPATRENLLEEQENRMKGNASVGPSELRTSADSASSPARSTHPRPQAASQDSSAAQDTPAKSSDASASSDRDTNVSFESAVSSHTIAFQPAAVAFTADAVSAQPSAAQSAAPASAAFAPTPQSSAPASPAPPQVPANAAPTRGYPVDSGQLRVTANNSELKISVQLPELGKVEVRAITAHDVTTAHLTAYRHDALPALAAERTGLEQALKARDVILGSLDSHAQDSHPPGQSAGQQRQQNSPSSAQFPSGTPSVAAATISATAEAAGILPAYSSISIRA